MLSQQTIEKLHTMKLHGMADAFHAQLETTDTSQLSFEERFALLVDQQWLWTENRALVRRLRYAHLKERGVMEDIDYQHPRGLDRKLMRTLATSDWVVNTPIFSCSVPPVLGKVGWSVLWPKKLAATASWFCTSGLRNYPGSWPWPTPTAVSAVFW